MKPKKHLAATFSLMVIAALLVACAGPAAAPMATPVPPTATPMPSTAAPTLVPPTATPTPGAATPAPPSPAVMGEVKLELGEITSQALAGNLLGDPATRTFFVLLPASYATSDKLYPVVYVLHWYTGDAVSLVQDFQASYKRTLEEGGAQEMIFVFPDADNRFGGSQYLSSPTIGDYETYLTQELVAHIDATYRTLPDRVSRGITGCSMGGDGSMGLALKYPNVFSVAAPASGTYDYSGDTALASATMYLKSPPEDFSDLTSSTPWQTEYLLSWAAAAAANPDKPPFYLDMPVAVVNGDAQIVPEVVDKMIAVDPVHDLDRYLSQPERLSAILIYHGNHDGLVPVELARDFDQLLTDLGIEHEYLETNGMHCNFLSERYAPVVKFMSDHLVGEETTMAVQTPSQMETGYADVNGTRLYYEMAGEGEPIVMIHGLGWDTRSWDNQFAEFAKQYEVIRYDMRGFGKSDMPTDKPYAHADDLKALLDYLGIDAAHVIGHSFGGEIAINFALAYPEATRSLVLIEPDIQGAQGLPDLTPEEEASFAAVFEALDKGDNAAAGLAIVDMHPLVAVSRNVPGVRELILQVFTDYQWWQFLNENPVVQPDPSSAERIGEIAVPTLLVVGDSTTEFQKIEVDRLAEQLPNARKVVFENSDHFAHLLYPEKFNALVLDFLAKASEQ